MHARFGHCASRSIGRRAGAGDLGLIRWSISKCSWSGFFENLRSERAIAVRCQDSLSVRAFLGYGLEESTPDHSSLSVIRQRLGPEIYQGVFEVVLTALKAHGLFKGRHLGIDSSVIEANASLRTLVHRNTEQAYWAFFGDFRGILSRAEIEFAEEEKDSGSKVVEGAEAARIGLDGLDA